MSIVQSTAIAALVFELSLVDGGVPTEAHLLPAGEFRATDGRPYDCANWRIDAEIAARVIERVASRTNDTLIDFEHQSLRAMENGQRVPAAGWFRQLEWREGQGLYATQIKWVGDTADLIAKKQYRYISAVFPYYPSTGEVLDIVSVALTNTPALDGLESLADLVSAQFNHPSNHQREVTDMEKDQQIAALTAERDANKQSLAALTTENANLKENVAALTDRLKGIEAAQAAAEAKVEQEKKEALIVAALASATLAPVQRPWAESLSLAQLTAFVESAKPMLPADRQAGAGDGAGDSLTEVELAMCTRMGVSPEDYKKTKAA